MENLKKLREITGAGILDCQKALKESNNDMDLAMDILRKKGFAKAANKMDRRAAEGVLAIYVTPSLKTAAVIELNCETDFVARNDAFKNAAMGLAKFFAESSAKDLESLQKAKMGNESIEDYVKGLVLKFGENTLLGFADKRETSNLFGAYLHTNSKIAVLVEYVGTDKELAVDVALQAAAMAPMFLDESSVDKDFVEKERAIYRDELNNSGKPAQVIDKIVDGKIAKYYESICLIKQKFIKNMDVSVEEHIKDKIKVISFKRYALGEK